MTPDYSTIYPNGSAPRSVPSLAERSSDSRRTLQKVAFLAGEKVTHMAAQPGPWVGGFCLTAISPEAMPSGNLFLRVVVGDVRSDWIGTIAGSGRVGGLPPPTLPLSKTGGGICVQRVTALSVS